MRFSLILLTTTFFGCSDINISNLDTKDFAASTATEVPTKIAFKEIIAVGKARCASCHFGEASSGGFNFDPENGIVPEGDQAVLEELKASGKLDVTNPAMSLFLTRPLAQGDSDTHPAIFENTDDKDAQTILTWITHGAP